MAKGEFSRGKRRKASGQSRVPKATKQRRALFPPSASNKEPMEAVEGMEMMKVTAMVLVRSLGGERKAV